MKTFSTDSAGGSTTYAVKHQDLLSSIWLYIDWFYVTKNLTTEERDFFADSVDAASYRRAEEENSTADWKPVATRWWHDDYTGLSPTDWNFK